MAGRRGLIALTEDEQKQYLEDGWTLQVASIGKSGFPHMVAMWYVLVDGKICFSTFRKSQKILNLRRDPKVTVMLESGKQYEELTGMVIEGEAELVEDVDFIVNVMARVGEKYNGIPIPTDTPDQALKAASKRVVVRINPTNVYTWDHRKLGGVY